MGSPIAANLFAMARAIACPDKFKGTLSARAAAAAIAGGLTDAGFDAEELPLADGGDGTLDVLVAATSASLRSAPVTGPLGSAVDAEWARLPDGSAFVEMARASGLALVPERERDPLRASTRGTGELIAAAARSGARRIMVGVGGSATTDGGLGAVTELGWSSPVHEMVVACDVTTPFLDAAKVYGPQKGATAAQVALLTRRLERLAQEYLDRTGVDVTTIPGAGAAGGLAGGLAALGASLESGFDVVADTVGLGERIESADLVVTGEGRLDGPSFEGKVVGGVLDWARDTGTAAGVITGQATDDARERLAAFAGPGPVGDGLIDEVGPVELRTLVDRAWSTGEAFARAAELTREAAIDIGRAVLAR